MLTRILMISAVALTSLSLGGCKDDEACQKQRLEGSDKWKAVYESASRLKLSGGPGWEDLDATLKARHHDAFAEVEKQSEMVFQSFAFQKITWNTADPARDKANKAFHEYSAKGDYKAFQTTLDGANKQYDLTASACK
jgi:hypothetical protein